MAKREFVVVPVIGPLDTANPATNRQPGVSIDEIDTAHRWKGPRRGGKAQTWVRQSTFATLPGAVAAVGFDGTTSYVVGEITREQADLGLQWTLDLGFHATQTRAVATACPIFTWEVDGTTAARGIAAIEVGTYGSSHANANKVYAIVKTTSSAGVVGNTYTLVGGTPTYDTAYKSSNKIVRVFVRLVRDAGTLTLLDSTPNTTTNAAISSTQPHQGATTGTNSGLWWYATNANTGANALFKGVILRALLRTGAVSTSWPLPAMEHCHPRAGDVRFFGSSQLTVAGHVRESSLYSAHGLAVNCTSPTAERHHPLAMKTQGMGTFTDQYGVASSLVKVGGILYSQRMK